MSTSPPGDLTSRDRCNKRGCINPESSRQGGLERTRSRGKKGEVALTTELDEWGGAGLEPATSFAVNRVKQERCAVTSDKRPPQQR